MSATLQNHRAQFQEWCLQALRYHAAGDGRSALMHARLCGEVVCKIALLQGWTEARALEAIAGSSFQELLTVVQRNAMVSAPLLSGLHVMRSTGNKASHGDPFLGADVDLAMAALRMVSGRLFAEVFREPMPNSLTQAFEAHDPQQRLARERDALRRELEEGRRASQEAKERDAQRIVEEQRSIAEREARIHAIERSLESLAGAQAELLSAAPMRVETRVEDVPAPPSAPSHRMGGTARWVRWWMVLPAMLILAAVVWSIFRDTGAEVPRIAVADPVEPGTMRVLLLPFTVLQDDPNVKINIHDALRKRLEDRMPELPLRLRIIADTVTRPGAISMAGAIELARKHKVRAVFFGEVYEPTASDSGRIELRYADTTASSYSGTMGLRAFRSLADSAAIRTLIAANTITEIGMAGVLYDAGRFSEILAMLYTTPTVTAEGRMSVQLYRATCYRRLRDFPRALRELEQVLAHDPDNAQANAAMGYTLAANGSNTAAIRYMSKAVAQEPRQVDWCLKLASLVGETNDPTNLDRRRARALIEQAFRTDSSRADVWDLMGQVARTDGRLDDARHYFEQALRKDSTFTQAQHDLAELLAVDIEPPEYPQAEQLLRKVLRADSSRAHAALLLGQLLNKQHKEPDVAQRLFRKSHQEDPQWQLSALRGEAQSAAQRGDLDVAIGLFQQVIALDPQDLLSSVRLGKLYQQRGQYDLMLGEMRRSYALDSMGHEENLNLGTFYRHALPPHRDLDKAEHHLRRALRTDPYDVYNMAELATVLAAKDKTPEAVVLCERVTARDPGHLTCSSILGRAYHLQGRLPDARTCFERALQAHPAEPTTMAGLAGVLVDLGPKHRARAMTLLEQAVQLAPGEGMLHLNLASYHLAFGDKSKAPKYYHQALALDPTLQDPDLEARLRAAGY